MSGISTIDDWLDKYHKSLVNEKYLLSSMTYALNKNGTKFISLGLSIARNFETSIIIHDENECISISLDDWYNIANRQEEVEEYFKTNDRDDIIPNMSQECIIQSFNFRGLKLIQISYNPAMVNANAIDIILDEESMLKLFRLKDIINYRAEMLENMSFKHFYNNMLVGALANSHYDVIENLNSMICSMKFSNKVLCLKELMLFNELKIQSDFEIMKAMYG